MTRLLPPDMHLVYGGMFLQPYSPDECDPDFLENRVLHLDGEFEGVSILLGYLENTQEYLKQAPEETIRRAKEEVRGRLIEYAQSSGTIDPMGIAEYEGDTSSFNMSRGDLQYEFDQLCKEHDFPAELVVKIVSPPRETICASTGLYGMPRSRQPHLAMIYFNPAALSLGKPHIRSVIRHEFAHCLADLETWPEGTKSSDHFGPEWERACERLDIKSDATFEPFENGYIKFTCPDCNDVEYALNDDECLYDLYDLYEWDQCCEACGSEYVSELRHEPLILADSGAYIVHEDGRESLLVASLERMLPWCFLC